MAYKVQVLSSKEFDELPYQRADEALGIADPDTKTAYIRYSGLPELDKYLINHEVEHLIEQHGGEHSHHYQNGVYYKFPALGLLGGALGQFAPAIGFIQSLASFGSSFSKPRGGSGFSGGGSFGAGQGPNVPAAPEGPGPTGGAINQPQVGSPVDQVRAGLEGDRSKGFFNGRLT